MLGSTSSRSPSVIAQAAYSVVQYTAAVGESWCADGRKGDEVSAALADLLTGFHRSYAAPPVWRRSEQRRAAARPVLTTTLTSSSTALGRLPLPPTHQCTAPHQQLDSRRGAETSYAGSALPDE